MGNFLQGQDVTIQVLKDGKQLACCTLVTNFRVSFNVESVFRDYLGERAPRTDMTYGGGEFDGELEHQDPSYLTFVQAVQSVAQHRTPGIVFSIGVKVKYPTGQTVRFLLRDVAFSGMQFGFGGRTDAVKSPLSGKFGEASNLSGATAI
jgi:hypothetical protein